ncbi:MAG: hypothetical protein EBY24_19540 [Betaproteobacteria bacterium]|nr:hypothetical protein [Betaproteobacteria bacterium]
MVVEEGPTEALVARAAHPYTRLLVASVPEHRAGPRRTRIKLAGEASALTAAPQGCRFAPRCPLATDICRTQIPMKLQLSADHWSACHHALQVASGDQVV